MSIFNSAVLTKKGNELLVTAAAGKRIIFTRLVTGCGTYTEEEKQRAALEQAEGLKEQRQQLPFSKYEKASETSVLLTALITNKELTEGYKITEIGVYGKEVGNDEDFLCSIAVTRSMEETDSFPPYNGLRECQIIQDYYITISPDAEVTVNTQGAAAMAEDLEKLKKEVDRIPRIIFGPRNMEIQPGDVLFIVQDDGEFMAAGIENIALQPSPPQASAENWGKTAGVRIVDGRLVAAKEPDNDTTFLAQF